MQKTLHAEQVLLASGWRRNVRLTIMDGVISAISCDVARAPSDERVEVLLPGMPNLHSHAFQRGMAGLTEMGGHQPDSFWSWRKLMYHFALSMTPDQVEAVAAQLYMEMLEAGFSRVGEFHYLHHDKDGQPYANKAEMAERIAAAADQAGIRLTLLPVFYAHSGFGGLPPVEGQRRFINTLDGYAHLLDASRNAVKALPGGVVGVAPHSLRAATLEEISTVAAMADAAPVHIHIAEQIPEVEACQTFSGKRPVEYLLDHAAVDDRWCMIHATHMTPEETRRLVRTGAIAGLCPVTEANLGDGAFNALEFLGAGGRFGIGSDSNVLIGIPDELRQLEYSQRIKHHQRNVLAVRGDRPSSTGRALFDGALAGGCAALQGKAGLAVGVPADIVSLNLADAQHLAGDTLLDGWLFAGACTIQDVWINGKKRVENGRHTDRQAIAARFRATMKVLAGQGGM